MRFKYTFEVKGRIKPKQLYSFEVDDFLFDFFSVGKFIRNIYVSFPISENELPTLEKSNQPDTNFDLTIVSPRLKDVEEIMRQLEGILSLWGIESIDIKYPKHEWLAETEEEKQKLKVFGYSVSRGEIEDHEVPEVPFDLIASAIISSVMHKNHDVLMSFFRRGNIEVESENYIEAIYYFYFIIESFYADGKNKNYAVQQAFQESPQFIENVKSVISEKNVPPKLISEFEEHYKNKDVKVVIKEIVMMRGFLHHFSKKRRDNWHPDKQENYQVHAYFLQKLSLNLMHENLANEHLTKEVYAKYNELVECGRKGNPLSIIVSDNQR